MAICCVTCQDKQIICAYESKIDKHAGIIWEAVVKLFTADQKQILLVGEQ
jgi:hypothetical protein